MSERVAVIGAGTMGHGIAQVCAMAGYDVVLVDTMDDLVRRGIQRIRENLDGAVARGKATADARAAAMSHIQGSSQLDDAVSDAGIVIEAVPERMDLKHKVLAQIDAAARADALIATNTSSLSIDTMQQALARPGRFLGLHFFNPVHINPLVEVVRGVATDEDAIQRALALIERIGKQSVVVRNAPGFATSRLGVLLGLEAIRMVEEGVATPEDIDKALELGYRHPMGPLRLTDLVGLDVRLDIARHLSRELGDRFAPPKLLEDMVAAGKLGKKTGQGFYRWTEA